MYCFENSLYFRCLYSLKNFQGAFVTSRTNEAVKDLRATKLIETKLVKPMELITDIKSTKS